ncbi:hypothetical protein [Microbacterium maritypicum]|uniref:hypothetical protein n=1 Tax=Microbacterium maritypicum TaxID=33918 RepID=UPI00142F15B9|nr:hypothetical protein [Microbacterium liquefaciens]
MPDTVQVLANSREDVEANRAVLVHGKDGLQEHRVVEDVDPSERRKSCCEEQEGDDSGA